MIRKNGTGGPRATQDQHENNRARTGKCAERDTERHKNNKETLTRDRPRSQREAAGGGKRKAKAAEPGRQEERSKSHKNTQTETNSSRIQTSHRASRDDERRAAGLQEPPKHTQSKKLPQRDTNQPQGNQASPRKQDCSQEGED